MNLESHPLMHWVVVFVFYNCGLLVNVLGAAFATMLSKMNGIRTVSAYLKLRWIPLAMRWFISVCMFFIVWENPALLGNQIEKIMPNFLAHIGVSGLLGFTSDAVFDRVLGILAPGIHKTLPPVPDAAANPNTPA